MSHFSHLRNQYPLPENSRYLYGLVLFSSEIYERTAFKQRSKTGRKLAVTRLIILALQSSLTLVLVKISYETSYLTYERNVEHTQFFDQLK